jgi:hypothetical protein
MRRLAPTLLLTIPLALTALAGCDSPKESSAGGATSTAAAKPSVEIVARSIGLLATLTGTAPGAAERETWEAFEGQMYAVVTAQVVRNDCVDGDKLNSAHGAIVIDKKTIKATGGGESEDKLCVLCEAKEEKGCSGGVGPLKSFTFVFSVPKDADVSKAQLRYKDAEASLSSAKVTDKRGNDEVNAEIKAKREQIEKLKKKLENTGSVPKGKIILGEIDQIEKEIENLQNKRK